MNDFIRPGVSFASVLRRFPTNQAEPSNEVRQTRDRTKETPEPPAFAALGDPTKLLTELQVRAPGMNVNLRIKTR